MADKHDIPEDLRNLLNEMHTQLKAIRLQSISRGVVDGFIANQAHPLDFFSAPLSNVRDDITNQIRKVIACGHKNCLVTSKEFVFIDIFIKSIMFEITNDMRAKYNEFPDMLEHEEESTICRRVTSKRLKYKDIISEHFSNSSHIDEALDDATYSMTTAIKEFNEAINEKENEDEDHEGQQKGNNHD